MRLRKPCSHGRYEEHQATVACPDSDRIAFHYGDKVSCTVLHTISCPGGESPTAAAVLSELVADGILVPHAVKRRWFMWVPGD